MSSIFIFTLEQKIDILPGYLYPIIALAQGLKKKNHTIFSNYDYWYQFETKDYLIQKSQEISYQDCDIVIFPCQLFSYGYPPPDGLFNKNRKFKTVLIDTCDRFFSQGFLEYGEKFDFILKQKNSKIKYPSNVISSWVYGLTNEIIQAFENIPQDKNTDLSINYRNDHGVRAYAEKKIFSTLNNSISLNRQMENLTPEKIPGDIKQCRSREDNMFYQSGFRHNANYLKRIRQTKINACFGGDFFFQHFFDKSPISFKIGSYFLKNRSTGRINNILKKLHLQLDHTYGIYQWDSYRMWETFAAGTVVLQVDFEKYGIEWPKAPINMKEYVGVDLNNPIDAAEKIEWGLKNHLKIGENGKNFSLKHYSPESVAQRFIDIIN